MLKCEVKTHSKCIRIEQEGFKKSRQKGWKPYLYLNLKNFHGFIVPRAKLNVLTSVLKRNVNVKFGRKII
jgi:hypothetical protein